MTDAPGGSSRPLRRRQVLGLATSVLTTFVLALGAAVIGPPASAATATLRLSPTQGPVGTSVSVQGSGFPRSKRGTVLFGSTVVTRVTTDGAGSFSGRFTVPVAPLGTATVRATVGTTAATAAFTVATTLVTTTTSTTSTTSTTMRPTTTTTAPAPTTSTTSPPAAASVLLGVSTPSGPANLAELDEFERDARKRVGLVMYFQGWAYHEFNPDLARAVANRGAIPMVTWEPWDYILGINQPAYSLATIIAGAHDAYITRWAQAAKAYGGTVFVRLAHEMNAKYYPWSEGVNGNLTPGQYVLAWRHVVGKFRSVGATNVKFVWNPNISYAGTTPLAGLYPGDAWVDWVAVDGYNGGSELPWGGFLSFQDLFAPTLNEIKLITTSKPVMIGETASVEGGGSKADWIANKFAQLASRPEIKAFVWFNHNKEADWRIQSSDSARQSFADGASNPRYG